MLFLAEFFIDGGDEFFEKLLFLSLLFDGFLSLDGTEHFIRLGLKHYSLL
jgi:hypothetical protein